MELKTVLDQLKNESGAGIEKTANAGNDIPKTSAAKDELFQALNAALSATEKQASEKPESANAAGELEKMATTLANADREVMQKEAELFGASVMDGFIARGAQFGIPLINEKTAGEPEVSPEEFQKWAQENPAEYQALVKKGQEAAVFEKWAATAEGQETIGAYDEGYKKAAAEVKKLASTPDGQEKLASFRQGYADIMQQLETIANSEGGQEKLAALKQGFEDGATETEKLAEDTYARGYNDTVDLINGMRE